MTQSWSKFITIFSILFLLYSCGSSKKQHISEYLKASKVEVLKTKETTTEVQKNIQRGYFKNKKHIVIYNNTKYPSLKEASRVLGINPKTVKKYSTVIFPEKIEIETI